jgi:hypothetical protein
MNRMFWCIALLCACGSNQPREVMPDMTDPAWAKDFEARADVGCGCGDALCLQKTHVDLENMLAAHGGLDEAPPNVHTAHGKFETCWRDGTRDIVRDFDYAAQKICSCGTAECLRLVKIEIQGLVDGKYREDLDGHVAVDPKAKASMDRVTQCIAKATMPAKDAMDVITRTTNEMCECKDVPCAQVVMKLRAAEFSKYVDVEDTLDRNKVADETTRWCGCLEKVVKAAAKEAAQDISPLAATSIDVSVNMKCR